MSEQLPCMYICLYSWTLCLCYQSQNILAHQYKRRLYHAYSKHRNKKHRNKKHTNKKHTNKMIKQFILLVLVASIVAAQCPVNQSGSNNSSPAKRTTSTSCSTENLSGPNNSSPGRAIFDTQVCSGHGRCDGKVCVCNLGYKGTECETAYTSSSCPANQSGPNNAYPARSLVTVCSGHGKCNGEVCVCIDGYTGDNCEIPPVTTCSPTEVPKTTTASSTEATSQAEINLSGKDNARSSNSASKMAVVGGILSVVVATVMV